MAATTRLDARVVTPMNNTNICNYYSSLLMYKKLLSEGEITKQEYEKMEAHLAKKYCIKIGSIIRANELINSSFRAMYISAEKGGNNE